MAYGRLGWDEDKFWNSSLSYFFKALKGFNDLEEDRQRAEWERLRILGTWVLSPYSKTRITPLSLLPLPWDKPKAATKEEFIKENEHLVKVWEHLENG